MASFSGRISSARLLRSARAHRTNASNSTQDLKTLVKKNEEETPKTLIELANEEETFTLFTQQKLIEKALFIKQRNEKIKEKKDKGKTKHISGEGKLVDGQIIYENDNDVQDDLDEFGEKDPTLIDGNQLPPRLGKIPKNMVHKPLDELG
jgi:hypothetical protein